MAFLLICKQAEQRLFHLVESSFFLDPGSCMSGCCCFAQVSLITEAFVATLQSTDPSPLLPLSPRLTLILHTTDCI